MRGLSRAHERLRASTVFIFCLEPATTQTISTYLYLKGESEELEERVRGHHFLPADEGNSAVTVDAQLWRRIHDTI